MAKKKAKKAGTVRSLKPKNAKAVKGGKAGSDPVKYMEVKLKEVLISGVTP
jgi:hypothetical protein